MKDKIVILGRTHEGKMFRPSQWCDMLAGSVSSFTSSKKVQYHQYLKPVHLQNEEYCGVMVDIRLQSEIPELYNFILNFAIDNELVILNGQEEEALKEAS